MLSSSLWYLFYAPSNAMLEEDESGGCQVCSTPISFLHSLALPHTSLIYIATVNSFGPCLCHPPSLHCAWGGQEWRLSSLLNPHPVLLSKCTWTTGTWHLVNHGYSAANHPNTQHQWHICLFQLSAHLFHPRTTNDADSINTTTTIALVKGHDYNHGPAARQCRWQSLPPLLCTQQYISGTTSSSYTATDGDGDLCCQISLQLSPL